MGGKGWYSCGGYFFKGPNPNKTLMFFLMDKTALLPLFRSSCHELQYTISTVAHGRYLTHMHFFRITAQQPVT
jgi:hypothetical protein